MNRNVVPFLIAGGIIPLAFAQPVSAPPDAHARVDKIFERYNRRDSPGCAVGVGIGSYSTVATTCAAETGKGTKAVKSPIAAAAMLA